MRTKRWLTVCLVVTLLAAGGARAQSPLAEADQVYQQGLALYEQGKLRESEALLQRALTLREKAAGLQHPAVAQALTTLGVVLVAQGRTREAEPHYRRSLAIREKLHGPQHQSVARTLDNLAGLLFYEGRFKEAEAVLLRTAPIWEKELGPENGELAVTLTGLGSVYKAQGRYPESESTHLRALAMKEKLVGPDHPQVAASLNNLGALYDDQVRVDDAERVYRRALAIRERRLSADHPDVAISLDNLAVLFARHQRYAEALPLARRALAIRERVSGPGGTIVAYSLVNLAAIQQGLKQNAEAEAMLLRAIAIREKAFGPDHHALSASLLRLADIQFGQGRRAEAESTLRRVIAIDEKALGPDHPDVARNQMDLAGMAFVADRDDEALAAMRRVAAIYRTRAAAIDDRRIESAGREMRFADDSLLLLTHLADRARDRVRRAALSAEAFEAAQLGGGRGTSAAVARMAARFASGSDRLAEAVRERQDAAERLRALDKALLAAVSREPEERDLREEQRLRDEHGMLDRRIRQLDARLAREFPRYAEIAGVAPLPLKDAQALLGGDEAMLVYQTGVDWAFGGLDISFLWVLRRDRAELIKLPIGRAGLEAAVTEVRATLDPSLFEMRRPPPFAAGAAHGLYTKIVAPAATLLKGAAHLLIVPAGALQSLPFGVLPTERPATGRPAKWLIRQHAITVLPSVASLRALRTFASGAAATEPFAGFGDPALDGRPGDRKGAKRTRFYRSNLADVDAVRAFAPLPETAGELRAMAKALGAGDDTVWLRMEATEARAKKIDLSRYRVLAFATHGLMAGQFRDDGEPALVLTPPLRATDEDDGLLGASEVAQLRLNAEWVILSACNTAAADGAPGAEGLSGLAKAFFHAGARSLLVSHWPVESQSSARLTTGAINALTADAGIGHAEALRRSMLVLMQEQPHAHPIFWAPFVVVGEGGVTRDRPPALRTASAPTERKTTTGGKVVPPARPASPSPSDAAPPSSRPEPPPGPATAAVPGAEKTPPVVTACVTQLREQPDLENESEADVRRRCAAIGPGFPLLLLSGAYPTRENRAAAIKACVDNARTDPASRPGSERDTMRQCEAKVTARELEARDPAKNPVYMMFSRHLGAGGATQGATPADILKQILGPKPP